MEVKCPKCMMSVPVVEGRQLSCPKCRIVLEVIETGPGFNLIGACDDQKVHKDDLLPPGDPVMEYYAKWQMRALFAIAIGLAIGFMLFLDMKNSYENLGLYFWKSSRNMIFPYIGIPVTLFLIGGGIWLYRHVDRDKKRYVDEKINYNQEDR